MTLEQKAVPNVSASSFDIDSTASSHSKDDALAFIQERKHDGPISVDESRIARIRRRVDWHVIPFLFLSYLLNYMDKVLLNYANVMGITPDLHLKGNDFSNASSAFWIAVLVAELPNAYLLQRLPTGKWLSCCLLGWGVCTAATAATTNYHGLLAARILCGMCESAIPPSLMLISGQWYTRNEQVPRFVIWYFGTAFGFVVGGFWSWAFQHVSPTANLHSWRIMFLALGCITVAIAVVMLFVVPDTPMQAKFLSDDEKIILLEHVKVNQTGIENRHFKVREVKEAFTDPQLWGMWLIMLLNGGGGGVITTYSSTLIKSFGYSPRRSALLNMGSGAVAITACVYSSYGVHRYGNRWLFIISVTIPTIIGAGLMSFLPHSQKSGLLAGIYLVNASIAMVPIQFGWMIANVAGHTKRAWASAILNAAFALGNIIGPQTFQAKDAPGYQPAKITMFTLQCAIVVVSVLLFLYYTRANKKRDARFGSPTGEAFDDVHAFAGLTDKENTSFRYTL